MEYSEENEEEEEQKIIDPEEAKKLEKEVFGEEKKLLNNELFIDPNAVYIDYEPQAAKEKLINFKDMNQYEKKTYMKHLNEIIWIVGEDIFLNLKEILMCIVEQSNEVRIEFLLQVELLISGFKQREGGISHIRDILIDPIIALTNSSDIHIKQNSGRILANIALLLDEMDRQKYILKIVLENAKDQKDEENRIVAVQQLSLIATCFEQNVCEQFVGLEILSLGDDPQLRVRKEAVQHLVEVAKLVSEQFLYNKIYPFYLRKAKDGNWGIRKCCSEIIIEMTKLVKDQQKLELQDILIKFLKDNNKWVKIGAYKRIGQFVVLQQHLQIKPEIFQYYLKMVTPEVKSLTMDNELSINCAYNFPAILQTFGKEKWPEMHNVLKQLIEQRRFRVKKPLACSLHEIAKIIGREQSWHDLIQILNDFLEDYSDTVKYGAVRVLADFLAVFENEEKEKMIDVFQILQQNKRKWRIRELIALQLKKLAQIYTPDSIFQYILPIVLKLCQDTVAKVRIQASKQIFHIFNALQNFEDGMFNEIVVNQIVAFSDSHRYNQRQSFILMSKKLVKFPDIFESSLLPILVKLSKDKVIAVRITLGRFAVKHYKKNGQFKENDMFKEILENLKNDKSRDVREVLLEIFPEIQLGEYVPLPITQYHKNNSKISDQQQIEVEQEQNNNNNDSGENRTQ